MTTNVPGRLDARPNDPQLWRLVQQRLEAGASWEDIANELGCGWRELVAWVLAYREDRQQRFRNGGAPPSYAFPEVHDRDADLALNARRFANWRRGRDGARATRLGQQAKAGAP